MGILTEYGDELAEQMNPDKFIHKKETPVSIESEPTATEPIMKEETSEIPSTDELLERVKTLAGAGSKALVGLRSLFEQVKEKIKRRDVERLEREIAKLEEEKKTELEKSGLLDQKKKLEQELIEVKTRKLASLI